LLYPEDLKYSKEHEWARVSGDTAMIGITHHAQDKLGDIVFVEMPAVGTEYKQMAEFGVVESVKTVSTLYLPVGGKVVEINEDLGSAPELINTDPYGKGWIIKVKMSDPADLNKLLSSKEYQKLLGE
jgi:glycine cleavage system H protein